MQTLQDPQKQWDVRAALASIHTEAAFVSPELRGPRPPSGQWLVFPRSLLSNHFFIRVKAPEFQGRVKSTPRHSQKLRPKSLPSATTNGGALGA